MKKNWYMGCTGKNDELPFHWEEVVGTTDFVLDGKERYFANLKGFRQVEIKLHTFDALCKRGKEPYRGA